MKKLYVDFETYFDTEAGYGLKEMSMTEYIRDPRFKAHGCGYFYEGEYGWVRGEDMAGFKDLDWENIEMIAHNVKFDGAIFAWKYGIHAARYFDTQSLARAVLGKNISSYSLKSVAEYLGLPPKGELESDGVLSLSPQQEKRMMEYNKRDLECCGGIDERLRPEFPEGQLWHMDWTARAFIEPTLELDTLLLEKMVEAERLRKQEIFKDLEKSDAMGAYVKWLSSSVDAKKKAKVVVPSAEDVLSSNVKFAHLLLANHLEVPMKVSPSDPDKRIPALSLSDPGFAALREKCPALYEARVAAKSTITEARGGNLASLGKTGAFPFDVQFSGAEQTHRYSGGSGGGGNPQNFPRKGDMRKAVRAPEGYKLVVGDFSAIEARLVAWLAKDTTLMELYKKNADVYSAFASEVYGRPINKRDNPEERRFGKEGILGLGYGMGTEKFQKRVKLVLGTDISEEEAKRVVKLYRTKYTVPALWDAAKNVIPFMASGYEGCVPFAPFLKVAKNAIILPSGLKLQYPNLRQVKESQVMGREFMQEGEWVYDVYKRRYEPEPVKLYGGKLVENICQALAGEICKLAIKDAIGNGLPVVGQVHDEIIGVVPSAAARDNAALLRVIMEAPVPFWPDLAMGAEVGIGPNWAEAKA